MLHLAFNLIFKVQKAVNLLIFEFKINTKQKMKALSKIYSYRNNFKFYRMTCNIIKINLRDQKQVNIQIRLKIFIKKGQDYYNKEQKNQKERNKNQKCKKLYQQKIIQICANQQIQKNKNQQIQSFKEINNKIKKKNEINKTSNKKQQILKINQKNKNKFNKLYSFKKILSLIPLNLYSIITKIKLNLKLIFIIPSNLLEKIVSLKLSLNHPLLKEIPYRIATDNVVLILKLNSSILNQQLLNEINMIYLYLFLLIQMIFKIWINFIEGKQNMTIQPFIYGIYVSKLLINYQTFKHQIKYIFFMSNIANYSPHNKSFKFILFQNQAYHDANKKNAKPCVRTNIRYKKVLNPNPQNNLLSKNNLSMSNSSKLNISLSKFDMSASYISMKSMVSTDKRVIHKNASYQKFERYRIAKQNKQMVQRLLDSSCQVIKNKKSKQSFEKHLKYKQIRRNYNERHIRKHQLVIPKEQLLSPTLASFRQSFCDFSESKIVSDTQLLSPILKRPLTTRSSLSKKKSDVY